MYLRERLAGFVIGYKFFMRGPHPPHRFFPGVGGSYKE
jgi:hypothetical protein